MPTFEGELLRRLEITRQDGLFRELRRVDSAQSPSLQVAGDVLRNFSSNDYLGLANHPVLREAAVRTIERFGVGSGASRLISGTLAPHDELEQTIAHFKATEAALSFSTGYAAAVGTLGALLGESDIVIVDKLVHACIVDGARMCGAKLRAFAHNSVEDLERILRWAKTKKNSLAPGSNKPGPQILVITESLFSMDGDQAPLAEIVRLKAEYGFWLMVDEAHSSGLYGEQGRGLLDQLQLSQQVDIQMGTLGKAFGASGGFICGSKILIQYLVNKARSFIFSTAPVPAASAAATAAIQLVQSPTGEQLRHRLWKNVDEMNSRLRKPASAPSAIIPILIGDETAAVQVSNSLREAGILIPAVRFPTVRRGRARLRMTLSAAHSYADIEAADHALRMNPASAEFMAL